MTNDTYTVILTEEQRQLLAKAVEKFSQLHLGFTLEDKEAAGKLFPKLNKLYKHGTNDLTK
jgi:hypothetical protein